MPGLLDLFTGNASPEQTQGLLGLAQGLLAASGPSRVPVSFGQALGNGLAGLQQGQAAARDQQMQALHAKLLGFQVKNAESDVLNQQQQRDRAQALQDFYRGRGAVDAKADPAAILGGDVAPTTANAERLSSMQPQAAPAGGFGAAGSVGLFQQKLSEAQELRRAGFGPEADAAEAAALKFQPKVKDLKQVQVGGKVMYAPVFEDGTPGEPIPYEAAVELARANTGGSTDLYNPITGATVRSLKNTASPDALLSSNTQLTTARMADARARDALEVQRNTAKVPAGYRLQSDGSLAPIPGGPADLRAGKEGMQRTQDARDVLSILDEAEPLLKKSTAGYLGTGADMLLRAGGVSTGGGEAAAQLKVLQGALVSKMPKMSGPQSDKDVQLYREMAGQIGDSTLPVSQRSAAMKTIRSLNEKYLAGGAAPAQAAQPKAAPKSVLKGQVMDGYRFKGGNAADPNAWEKI